MIWLWLGFTAVVIALLAIDLGVFNRRPHAIGVREAAGWSVLWIAVGLAFSGVIWLVYEHHLFGAAVGPDAAHVVGGGGQAVLQYLTGYVLEKSLSVDNLFVMAVLFGTFRVRPRYQHRVLFLGILGAIVTRGAMVFGGVWLVTRFEWLFYVFGVYLAYAGVRMLLPLKEADLESRWYVRGLRRILPVSRQDHGQRFLVREDGQVKVTMLLIALVAIELTDVVFAVDSVPAVLAISTDPFIVLTSNIFAILGLRSLYFLLAHMIARFERLKYSLAAILVVIGVKMLLHEQLKLPTIASLGIILGLLAAGIASSLLGSKRDRTAG
jgi:tellurite resistance protein TerC